MKKIFTLLFLLCSMNLFSQTIYYVKPSGSDANNGASWATAFKTLQKAINTINTGQIWVAAGTYYPDEGAGQINNDRYSYFNLKASVALYGGFAGSETERSKRNLVLNETILSGDIDQLPGDGSNAINVLRSSAVGNTTVLDGFTITHGFADRDNGNYAGGGGLYNNQSSPTISNCIFRGNAGGFMGGGAICNNESSPTITNCSFIGNWTCCDGGAISNFYSTNVSIVNCSFYNNSAGYNHRGAVENFFSSATIKNSIMWGNTSPQAGGIGSMNITYSIVEGGYGGTGNLDQNPLFINAAEGDLHISGCSPAVNAGTSNGAPSYDLDGANRPVLDAWDMGAYEFQPDRIYGIIYVNNNASGNIHDGASWATAFTSLQGAIDKAATAKCTLSQIWVATGTYYPTDTSMGRSASFILKNNALIYGGFEGTELYYRQLPPRKNKSILSGDINRDETLAGNSFHVVQATDVDNAILDGFIITGGNADGSFNDSHDRGGGMYSERSSFTATNCIFKGNYALNYGGGAFNGNMKYTAFINCVFTKNTSDYAGAAIYNIASSPRIINCSIAANNAAATGGGVYNISSSYPTITNSILWGNSNSITNVLGANAVVTYSLVEGGYTGSGNLAVDPLFSDTASGNLHLQLRSPAKDIGNDAAVPATVTTDLDGYPRFNGRVDMGAFEWHIVRLGGGGDSTEPFTITCPGDLTIYTDPGRCGAPPDYFISHPAVVVGGTGQVTVTYTPTSPGFLSLGANTVSVTAIDNMGETRTCSFTVTVVDSTRPGISDVSVSPSMLYPPNHQMRDITLNYNASDSCGEITALSVTSNEQQYGTGSGDTGPDWEIINAHHLRLRAERSGNGTGRIYTITITAKDASGNISTASTTVTVPHDKSLMTSERAAKAGSLLVKAEPNPSIEGFTLYTQSPSIQPLNIKVMDEAGRRIESRNAVAANGTIYIGKTYRPGVYYVQVMQGEVLQTIKLVKLGK